MMMSSFKAHFCFMVSMISAFVFDGFSIKIFISHNGFASNPYEISAV